MISEAFVIKSQILFYFFNLWGCLSRTQMSGVRHYSHMSGVIPIKGSDATHFEPSATAHPF